MSTLGDSYKTKIGKRENVLNEGIFDAFSSNADNTVKVREALRGVQSIAKTFGMKNVSASVAQASQKFEQSIANSKQSGSATAISYIVTFSDVMSDFFRELDQWIMQLPSMAQALEAAKKPENSQKTLKDLVGEQGDKVSPVLTVASIIQKQFKKSAGGFLKSIGRLFKTGSLTTAGQALKFVGLDSQKAADDVLNVVASKYNQLVQAGQQVPTVEINAQATPESGTTQSSASNQSVSAQTTTPAQQAQPATASAQSGGNVQTAAKPSPEEMQKRDTALQGRVRNRNAFVTQVMSSLSNEEIKSDLLNIAQALGIDLKR